MIDHNWIFLGAAFNLVGSITYVIATLQGKTKPNRVTWFLWALAPLIAFTAMLGEGVSPLDGLMTFMVGFGPLMVFIASFVNKKSYWKITTFDIICGVLSVLGIIAWAVTRTGMIAILFSVIADGLALLPTLVKSWKGPETENHVIFMNGAISALITLLALKVYDFEHLAFPVYIFVVCVVLFVLIKYKIGDKYIKKNHRNVQNNEE
jgi:hypothetical protein